MTLFGSTLGSFATGSGIGLVCICGAALMPVVAVYVLPKEARTQWAGCWKADLRELAMSGDTCAWLMQSYGVVIAAAKIRFDRHHPDSWWVRAIVWKGGAVPRGTGHVTPCPQSPESDLVRPGEGDRRT